MNEKNVTYLFVGNVTTGIGNGASVNIDTLPAGSTVVLDYTNLDATTKFPTAQEAALVAGEVYEIVSKLSDGTIIRSPQFTSAKLASKGSATYVQPTEQVSFLGYNGTTVTGLGTITLGNSYIVGLWLNHTKGVYSQQGEVKHISAYATDTLQATVVKNLMESHLRNFSPVREKYPSIICDRIAKTTSIAAATAGNLFKVTKGSKTVLAMDGAVSNGALTISASSITTDFVAGTTLLNFPSSNGRSFSFSAHALGDNTGDHNIIIGETVYTVPDAGTNANNATAIAAAINAGTQAIATVATAVVTITYREEHNYLPPVVIYSTDDSTEAYAAITILTGDAVPVKYYSASSFTDNATASFELDEPWQGATGYVLNSSTTEATMFGITTLDGASWGLKFTGIAQPFDPQAGELTQVNFDVLTDSFGDSVVEYKAVKPTPGHGTWKQVARLEAYAQGNENWYRTSAYPAVDYRREAVEGNTYNLTTVVFKNEYLSAATGIPVGSPWTATIATKVGLTAPAASTIFA